MTEFKLFVGNLSLNVNENHLREIFGTYGIIQKVDLPLNKYQQNLGWAIIRTDNEESMKQMIGNMNGGQIDGITIVVRPADSEDDKIISSEKTPESTEESHSNAVEAVDSNVQNSTSQQERAQNESEKETEPPQTPSNETSLPNNEEGKSQQSNEPVVQA